MYGAPSNPIKAVDAWYNEVDDCDALPGCENPKTAGKMVGHFTAMIWKGATHFACTISNVDG